MPVILVIVFCLLFSSAAFAQTANTGAGNVSSQNVIGDVVGPNGPGGVLGSSSGGSGVTTLESANIFTNGGGGILNQRVGAVSDSVFSQFTSFFDGLSPAMQSMLMDYLYSSDLVDESLLDIIAKFAGIQSLHDNIDNISCGNEVSLSEYRAYAQNMFLSRVKLSDILAGQTYGTADLLDVAEDFCGDAGIPQIMDPEVLNEGDPVTNPPIDPNAEPVPQAELTCKSYEYPGANDWRNLPGMNEYDNLHAEIARGAAALGMDEDVLAGVIYAESGGRVDARNPNSSASGLIQFMKGTAPELNTTIEEIRMMGVKDQMDLVIKYFKGRGWKSGMSPWQAYATIHAGNPYAEPVVDASGVRTDHFFRKNVLPRIEVYSCRKYDWYNLSFPVS